MNVQELLQKIEQRDLPPVILFGPGKAAFGKEPFEPLLADQAVQKIVAAYVDPGLQDLVYSVYHADETAPGEIANEAATLPFLAEQRVIVVRNADKYSLMSGDRSSPFAPLAKYLDAPSERTLILFIASKADKRKKFYRVCAKNGAVVECPQLTDPELVKWIQTRVTEKGKTIKRDGVEEILERTGGALGDINNAVDLVINYIGDATAIRREDVVAACAHVSEETVWNLTDAIAASNPDKALRALYQLLDFGQAPDQIMAVINWMLESAYRAAPDTRVSSKSSFVAKKMQPLVQKLGVAKLRQACALCTDTHFMIRTTGVDKMLALEMLVIKLSAPRRRTAR